jgi:hypothetical protein
MRWVLSLLLISQLALPAELSDGAKRWWKHVEVLAADDMEGRNTGSAGHKKAARYVSTEFERAGLAPYGTKGYLQPIQFDVRQIREDNSSMSLVRDGKEEKLKLGEDAVLSLRGNLAPSVEAPLVFIGHGLQIPEAKYDDLAGLDLKGKVVVYLTGGPSTISSALKSHYSHRSERWTRLRNAGAIGQIEIPNPKSMDIPWERSSLARLQPSMSIADPTLNEVQGMQFSATMNPAHADKLFVGTGHTFAEILAAADGNKPLPRFAIPAKVRATASIVNSKVESENVVALLEGSDPVLKKEFVVLSAHLDHVGVGEPIDGDRIYNGAMDNASGIASLLEVARMMKESGAKPKRSVVFLAVTGEEKGLQGSRYYSKFPTAKGRIVANINMDMYLPLFPLKMLEVQGLSESTLGDMIKAACGRAGVAVQADKEPNRNLFIRSDQYSFIREGVPALAFKFGFEFGTPEEKIMKEWLKKRYHAPSDDLAQPVDKEGAAKFNLILMDLIGQVANAPKAPEWKPDSFFKRFAKPAASGA